MEERPSIPLRGVKVDVPSTSSSSSATDLENSPAKRSIYSISVTAMDLVNHVLIICVTVFLLSYSLQSFTTMNLHVTLCTLGYVLLMSEAIVVLAGESILTNFLTRRAKSHVHWVLQVLGLICTVAGVVVMYQVKSVHFRSVHALLGIASVVIMVLLAVCGYPVFIAAKLRNLIRPVIIKFGHNLLGICCFVLGMTSQCYGYKKGWLPNVSKVPNVQCICIILTAVITVLSLRGALASLVRQLIAMLR
ncbi:transmembrane reductase CYB561D2 [Andrena cerasifolii]|uniref:transmembrane reductase CYB561D2 n=1 Tax=Andrena cerasifolii TaxID=2819439 RepID=UPI0040378C84